ncbi:L-alanyl-gamma-D-glutamyl-meso-diaminopimelate ligase [Pseudomonas mandelii JR-1]|uniref:L-alanyl-gamma-D-glutamyl-meso-diaminopimelate ligase n=1 Tax=Pseudomonas mandelii JR-1 TaxID=1147786 RepID=A0A024EES2_9PSED|nr:L-alanyl-gamma-D-glutamyl-meso-diaminopimelate ligase [Pseudomonas mandelii JR-1]
MHSRPRKTWPQVSVGWENSHLCFGSTQNPQQRGLPAKAITRFRQYTA